MAAAGKEKGNMSEMKELLTYQLDSDEEEEEDNSHVSSTTTKAMLSDQTSDHVIVQSDHVTCTSDRVTRLPPALPEDTRLIMIIDKKKKSRNRYPMPEDYLTLSLLACCLCCPIGIVALLNSQKVQYYFEHGDLLKSRQYSLRTYELSKRAITIGCILLSAVIAFWLTIALILTAIFKPNEYY